ncbi:MAG: aminotransferase class III-fold pyridoxal phosphate-dependent enzyme, partial [Microbacteriaceae bacterium]|nr:aminotransferase class III-fold pyridoxal phosphate-dependent enzyme [Microbacteriaceae bacterium]
GALITFGAASDLFQPGQHGSTFGGNPLATAAGNAVLGEIVRAGLIVDAWRIGAKLHAIVEAIDSPLISEVRGQGALLGLGLTQPVAGALSAAAFANGLIINAPNDASIRIAPPLIIGDAEFEEFRDKFTRALQTITSDAK